MINEKQVTMTDNGIQSFFKQRNIITIIFRCHPALTVRAK